MKKKLSIIMGLALVLIFVLQINTFANTTLNLNINVDKEEVQVGEEIKVIVNWKEGMQAADFYLKFDSDKLEYIKSDIEDHFINLEDGVVKTAWFSIDDVDKTQIEYTFKALKSGTSTLTTEVNGGFATGNLRMPRNYENGELTIKIQGNSLFYIIAVIVILIILIIFVTLKKKNIKSKKIK